MKIKLLGVMAAAILFLMPNVNYAQAPVLGTAASFVLFTTNGAMTCSGTKYLTHLTGNVGSNLAGSVTGFGNVDGVMHADDATTGLCVPDVVSLYTDLSTRVPTGPLASPFGGGDTLVAGVYEAVGAATLTGNLILNGQGNPNALFIFQVGGVLTTNALSKIILINGALACNVFWQVNGAINVGTGTTLRGTIVANGQIDMTSTLDTLEGRAFAENAAVLVSQLVAYTPIGCGSSLLTGPAAPPMLDSTAAYGVFSSIGAVTSTPVTYVIGSVGANTTTPTGFNPLDVTGAINAMNTSTAAAAADLTNIYNYLVALPADIDLLDPADFGHGLVLTPHSYQVTGITQLTGNIILNAEGDANAVFVIKINGSYTTSTFSHVVLMNGAQAKNVYWKIDGAVDIYSNSVFNGTMVVAGAISLETGDTLNGRALTINGAVAIDQSYVDITPISTGCVAPAIGGTMNVCPGATTALTDSSAGGTWSSSNTAVAIIDSSSGIATGILPGTSTITYTTPALCTNTTTVTVNPAPLPITGPGSVCAGSTITLNDLTTGGTWSSSNTSEATAGTGSGIVGGVAAGTPIITYSVPGSCNATKMMVVGSNAGVITGPSRVCIGATIMMADSTAGGSWTGSNGNAAVIGNSVTGMFAGADTIMYTVTDICGTMTATKIINVDSTGSIDSIAGASTVCAGHFTTLTDATTGGVWSASNTNVAVAGGNVSGIFPGSATVSYTIINGCGTVAAMHTVTVNPFPDAGIISGAPAVCAGSTTGLTESVTGGIWSSSNTALATVGTGSGIVSGVGAGTDMIRYAVTNSCGTATANFPIIVNPTPDAGTISGPSNVCVGSSIILTDAATGGVWSSSNTNAVVAGGTVTGGSAGADTIMYTVTSLSCTGVATKTVTVNATPSAGVISGTSIVCEGATITLVDIATGGIWSSSNGRAVVVGGVVTGISAGIDTIIYTVSNASCTAAATKTMFVNPIPDAGVISGLSAVCTGSAIMLTDAATGGIWSSSNTTAAVAGGIVTGVSAGADTIMYTVTSLSCTGVATKTVTVNTMPSAGVISGTPIVCEAATITLTDMATGGVWSSSNGSAAVVDGIVTGISAGTDTIMYLVSNAGCTAAATKTIIVSPLPDAGVISGLSRVCVGSSITLTESATGGTWSSSNGNATAVSGLVTGVTTGIDTIIYTVNNVSCTATATKTVTVNPFLTAGTITGPTGVCIGSAITLTDAITGGVWSSSNSAATVALGVVAGVTQGTDTIRYAVTNACGTATATKAVTVSIAPAVPVISTQPTSSVCTGTLYQNFGAAAPAATGITYSWTAVNAVVWAEGTGHQYALVNFNEPGSAVVTLNATLTGSSCASHSSVTVSVGAAIAQAPEVSYFTSHFVCTPSNEDSYQWGYDNVSTLDSTLLPGEINQDYLNTSPDFYNKDYWAMTMLGGCLQKTYYHTPTIVQNVNSGVAGITVYPNPANNSINVTISADVKGSIEVDVWNVMGQKMTTVMATDNKAVIDVSSLAAGSYLISCYSDGAKIAAARFIKN